MTMSAREDAAISFLKLAAGGRIKEAYDTYVAPGFRHHNPYFKGDAASLRLGMEQSHVEFPNKVLEVKRALEDGNLVAVHCRIQLKPGTCDYAVIHIFLFEGDKIAEMWEAGQQVPENLINEYGVF
ncbi:polyketide cyclase [candidate division GN15 bacterium]|uniref:Polyketide cyclase n=1 Tax=candidate division GN15 bacterium TaxID=2072418 RepID=A0A855X2W9_9BACT|nr:MAG: polyketide cyclase [candidate division GN15 bacterium]